jgi:threonine dehydrogenase-like Zn-dependent dehydrogenase
MTSGAVFMNSSKIDTSIPLKLSANNENIIFAGFSVKNFAVNMEEAFAKHLTISTVTSGYNYIPSAINLIATKAIKVNKIVIDSIDSSAFSDELKKRAEQIENNQHNKNVIINMMNIMDI